MRLDIVTPETKAFSDEVDNVVVPGSEGDMGILPAHAPIVGTLRPGELVYKKEDEEYHLAVGTGIVEISKDRVSVLTDMALGEHELDEEDVIEQALERAQKAMEEKSDPEDVAAAQVLIQKQLAKLHVKRRRRRRL